MQGVLVEAAALPGVRVSAATAVAMAMKKDSMGVFDWELELSIKT